MFVPVDHVVVTQFRMVTRRDKSSFAKRMAVITHARWGYVVTHPSPVTK